MRRTNILLTVLALISLQPALLASGGQTPPLPVESLFELDDIHAIELTTDGEWVALQIGRSNRDYERNKGNLDTREVYVSRIEIVHLPTGRRLDPLPGKDVWNPVWSPDGTRLFFQSGVDDAATLWVWSRASGLSRQVSALVPRRLNASPVWTADSRRLVIPILPEGLTNEDIRREIGRSGENTDYPLDRTTPGATVALYQAKPASAVVARQDFPINRSRIADLVLLDAETGAHQRLVTGRRPVRYSISPDGRMLAYLDSAGQDQGSGYRNLYDLHVLNLATGAARVLSRDIPQAGIYMDVSWSPDSKWLAWADTGPISKGQVYFADVASGEIKAAALVGRNTRLVAPQWDRASEAVYLLTSQGLCRTPVAGLAAKLCPAPPGRDIVEILTSEPGHAAFNPRGELLLRTRDGKKEESFDALDVTTDEWRRLHAGPFSIASRRTQVNPAGTALVFARQSASECLQAWTSDTEFARPVAITRLNPQLAAVPMGRSRLIEWRGIEGQLMQGALLLPPGYQEGQRCPVVVYLYGDDKLSNDLNFFGFNDHMLMPYENMQLLATRGIAVLRPDTVTRLGRPMHDIAASIHPALDRLVEVGIADPARLGIMGRSYGGYSVMAVLVQTDRFRAAIEVCGQANLLGVYREMDMDGTNWKISWAEEYQGKMGGSPWKMRDRWVENSPFFYLDRVTTPLLIAHGTEDTAVAVEAGDELFLSLRHLGKEVEYAKYLGEAHVIAARANSIDYANRMIAWFERHLKAPVSEPAKMP